MDDTTIVARACRLSAALTLGLLCSRSLVSGELKLDFGRDFDWTVVGMRSEFSVKREIPACVGFTEGKDVDFTSRDKPFTVIAVTLRAKKSGTFDLIPELFLMRDGLQYRVCHGVRVLAPEPDARTAAFHPPNGASVWPGHIGDRIHCGEGDSIDIELLFDHVWKRDRAELLVASGSALHGKIHGGATAADRAVTRLRQLGAKVSVKDGVATDFALRSSTKITDADLAVLNSLSSLETFTLIGCPNVTDAGYAHLKKLPRLQQLNLSPSNITDAGLVCVKAMKDLWMLGLNGTRVTDAGLKHLIDNRRITVLYLNNTRITDDGLIFLEQMKDMHWMDLNGTAVTDAGLAHLGHMSNMKLLHLDRTAVTDAGLARLAHFSKLQLLSLNGTAVTDAGMAHVAKLSTIERLLLSDTRITDDGLIHVAKLPHLRELQLLRTRVTQCGVDAIRRVLPNCEIQHSYADGPSAG